MLNKEQRIRILRLAASLILFILGALSGSNEPSISFMLLLAAYLIAGFDVLMRAVMNIFHGQVFDENFLMCVATVGAWCLKDYREAVAVMLFYQTGELFQDIAVERSRRSIADLMDIRPDYAYVEKEGKIEKTDPENVDIGECIVIQPGERVPLDGIVVQGSSQMDTAALTGESMPREVKEGDDIISGTVNISGLLHVKVTKPYGESTVSRILEMVESAGDKKAHVENFITRFARYYTPAVCITAALLAIVPPLLLGQGWGVWVERGLIFLVVSCPCALVISVPLSFFGGIGGASKHGVLIKGSNYLEALSRANTVVFDKTGTLTSGVFQVVAVHPERISEARLLEMAAYAEAYSTHPIAASLRADYHKDIDKTRIGDIKELAGHGVRAIIDGSEVLAGNEALMRENSVESHACHIAGTAIHVAIDGEYAGHIIISDVIKPDARKAIEELHQLGVKRTVMLTGDKKDASSRIAAEAGVDEYHAELLPQDKVAKVEELLAGKEKGSMLAFAGDGINDAPVLTRADIGIAMGAMGSDAAIEAADVVLMNDRPSDIAMAVRISKKTMGIVRQNIVFALAVKALTLIFAALGIASMWWAVFADVGVAFIAILNAMRCLRIK